MFLAILREEDVPWVYLGDKGWKGAARMWAIDVVQGEDGRYFLFFPAPMIGYDMRIGVAVADHPAGPFWARPNPVPGKHGIDPSVIQLGSGGWAIFSSGKGNIYVQHTNKVFNWAGPRRIVTGLTPGYKEGPHAEIREGKLFLYYALSVPGKGYSILQAQALRDEEPQHGFCDVGLSIDSFDGRTNHAFNVRFGENEWIFYHRHFEVVGNWTQRRVIFTKARFDHRGIMETIRPHWDGGGAFRTTILNKVLNNSCSLQLH